MNTYLQSGGGFRGGGRGGFKGRRHDDDNGEEDGRSFGGGRGGFRSRRHEDDNGEGGGGFRGRSTRGGFGGRRRDDENGEDGGGGGFRGRSTRGGFGGRRRDDENGEDGGSGGFRGRSSRGGFSGGRRRDDENGDDSGFGSRRHDNADGEDGGGINNKFLLFFSVVNYYISLGSLILYLVVLNVKSLPVTVKRELYIPPSPSEDEKDLFATMAVGLNFEKYDDIPVEVTGESSKYTALSLLLIHRSRSSQVHQYF